MFEPSKASICAPELLDTGRSAGRGQDDRIGNSRPAAFRPDIEGIRGIAVLIVVAFHCGIPGFPGGFVGVDVFFVLSGYLITGLFVREIQKTGRIDLAQFYARRVRRLLPASALTLMVTLLIGALVLAPSELSFAARAARATALYASNVFFGLNAAGYFAPTVETNPLLHTWSLAVEEQFYLLWPLVILLGLRMLRSRRALWALLLGVTLFSAAISAACTSRWGMFAFYGLPARAWEFGLGGLAVLPVCRSLRMRAGVWLVLGWIGVAVIFGSATFILNGTGFPGWIAFIPTLGTLAALVAGAELPNRGVAVLLHSVPLQILGGLSYSWYLWHWPFLVLAKAICPNVSAVGLVGAALAALAVAGVTHRFVENPIRFHPYLTARPLRSICCGAVITVVSLAAAGLSIRFADRMSGQPELKKLAAATALESFTRLPWQQCVSLGESPEPKTCVFGNPSAETSVVLFGDSHAIQWFNPLRAITDAHGWKLTTVVKSGCPAIDVRAYIRSTYNAACDQWRADAIRRIIGMRPAAVIIGNWSGYPRGERKPGLSFSDWRDGTRKGLEPLSEAGLRVAVIRDNPHFTFDVPTCLARAIRHSWYSTASCAVGRAAGLDDEIFTAEQMGARDLPNLSFIDLTGQFCDRDGCPPVRGGEIVYRDDNHLTGRFADLLRPALESRILSFLAHPHEDSVPPPALN